MVLQCQLPEIQCQSPSPDIELSLMRFMRCFHLLVEVTRNQFNSMDQSESSMLSTKANTLSRYIGSWPDDEATMEFILWNRTKFNQK